MASRTLRLIAAVHLASHGALDPDPPFSVTSDVVKCRARSGVPVNPKSVFDPLARYMDSTSADFPHGSFGGDGDMFDLSRGSQARENLLTGRQRP